MPMTSAFACLLTRVVFAFPAHAQATAKAVEPATAARDDRAAEQLGWRLAVQAWTFRDRTAFEAIDTARALGLKYIELYPGQKLAPDRGDAKVAVDMSPALISNSGMLSGAGRAGPGQSTLQATAWKSTKR